MLAKIIDLIKCIITALLIIVFLGVVFYFYGAETGHNHEEYIEIVDKYITHNGRVGKPRYWVVYKFVDGCIQEMDVSSTEYYTVKE